MVVRRDKQRNLYNVRREDAKHEGLRFRIPGVNSESQLKPIPLLNHPVSVNSLSNPIINRVVESRQRWSGTETNTDIKRYVIIKWVRLYLIVLSYLSSFNTVLLIFHDYKQGNKNYIKETLKTIIDLNRWSNVLRTLKLSVENNWSYSMEFVW